MRGSRRCGEMPVRAVVWRPASRPRLSGGMLGLGSRLGIGVGGGGRGCRAFCSPGRLPRTPQACSFGGGSRCLPRCLPERPPRVLPALPCAAPGAEDDPGTQLVSRSFQAAGHLCEPHLAGAAPGAWSSPQPSVLRAAPGVHTCPRAGKVESGSSSSCCPRPASGRGSLLVVEVLISGFSGSGRPELEFRTPYSRHFFKSFLCQLFLSFKYVVGRQVGQNFPLPSLLK